MLLAKKERITIIKNIKKLERPPTPGNWPQESDDFIELEKFINQSNKLVNPFHVKNNH